MDWRDKIDLFRARARRARSQSPVKSLVDLELKKWRLILSLVDEADGTWWHLSAKLLKPENGSTEKDWKFLGAVAKYLGAPMDPLSVDKTDTATGSTHWRWEG